MPGLKTVGVPVTGSILYIWIPFDEYKNPSVGLKTTGRKTLEPGTTSGASSVLVSVENRSKFPAPENARKIIPSEGTSAPRPVVAADNPICDFRTGTVNGEKSAARPTGLTRCPWKVRTTDVSNDTIVTRSHKSPCSCPARFPQSTRHFAALGTVHRPPRCQHAIRCR